MHNNDEQNNDYKHKSNCFETIRSLNFSTMSIDNHNSHHIKSPD